MLGRRNLLRLAFGGVGAAVTGVKPKDAVSLLGAVQAGGIAGVAEDPVGECVAPHASPPWFQRMVSALYESERRLNPDQQRLPTHIAAMKSWSPAFKESEAEKERAAIRILIDEIHRDERRARAIAKLMGLGA
jgi:hypothetical protein